MTMVASVGLAAGSLASACGSDDPPVDVGAIDAGPVDEDEPTDEAGTQADDAASTGGETSAGATPSIDPASMPGPAEAVVTVDGRTIMYEPPDAEDTRLFSCELGADGITVNMQTPDGHDLLVQVAPLDAEQWAGRIVAKSRDDDRVYTAGTSYSSDMFAVDGPYMVFLGPFEYYDESDPATFTDAGEGQIAVTCP